MNGKIEVLGTESVVFPIKPQEGKISEVKSVKIEETIVTEIRAVAAANRFARLKRSLRKRSRSIL